jgi:hypothetical protein
MQTSRKITQQRSLFCAIRAADGAGFATLALPDSVGHYGSEEFDLSRDALKFFTSALNESYWTQVVEESGYVDAQPSVGPVPG